MKLFIFCFIFIIIRCYAHEFPSQKTEFECGVWSNWSCSCCGGCLTQRCVRTCQTTNLNGCGMKKCEGFASKIEDTPCTSPSQTCKFPLPVCCDGQRAYVNKQAKARWCKSKN